MERKRRIGLVILAHVSVCVQKVFRICAAGQGRPAGPRRPNLLLASSEECQSRRCIRSMPQSAHKGAIYFMFSQGAHKKATRP